MTVTLSVLPLIRIFLVYLFKYPNIQIYCQSQNWSLCLSDPSCNDADKITDLQQIAALSKEYTTAKRAVNEQAMR